MWVPRLQPVRRRFLSWGAWAWSALASVACAAGSKPAPSVAARAPVAAPTPASFPTPSTPSASASASASAVAAAAPPATDSATQELEQRLQRHFAQYRGGATFAFFEADFAPRVERYLALKDVTASELAKVAKAFYANKTQVSLLPKPGTLMVKLEGGRLLASFVLSLRWSYPPPTAAAACGYLDASMTWRPHSLIARNVEVTARIGFDANQRIASYEEAPLVGPRLRVATRGDALTAFTRMPTEPARFIEPQANAVQLPDGTIVEDLGESFTCGLNQTEVDTVRKVRFQDRTFWLLADWTYDTGHNFVGDTPLVPAH